MDLRLSGGVVIPDGELTWRFETSGGPGGQHANRSATKAILTFDVAASRALDDRSKERILGKEPEQIVVTADESRSQWRNRQLARRKLVERLNAALAPPPPQRRPTRPTRRSRTERLEAKRRQADKKRLRRRPDWD